MEDKWLSSAAEEYNSLRIFLSNERGIRKKGTTCGKDMWIPFGTILLRDHPWMTSANVRKFLPTPHLDVTVPSPNHTTYQYYRQVVGYPPSPSQCGRHLWMVPYLTGATCQHICSPMFVLPMTNGPLYMTLVMLKIKSRPIKEARQAVGEHQSSEGNPKMRVFALTALALVCALAANNVEGKYWVALQLVGRVFVCLNL